MPRKKRIPSLRHHKARNLAVVRLNGKDIYLGPWGSSIAQGEYDRIIAEWLSSSRVLPSASAESDITNTELVAKYWDFCRTYYNDEDNPRGCMARLKPVLRGFRQLYGRQLSREFGPVKLKAFRESLINKGQCRTSINANINRLRGMFRWGASEELIDVSIYRALETVQGLRKGRTKAREGKEVLPAPETDILAAIPFMPPVISDMVRLQWLTGARPGELCNLRPCDIDRTDNDVWVYRPRHHKTEHHGKSRTVCIGPKAQQVLLPYLLRESTSWCFSPAESEEQRLAERHKKRKTPLCCGNRPRKAQIRKVRNQYTTDSYRQAVKRACIKASVNVWSPNQLRHTKATEIRKSHGLEAVQVTLGHSNARVSEVYAERDHTLAVQVAKEAG